MPKPTDTQVAATNQRGDNRIKDREIRKPIDINNT
jgi:hypothetical protein